MAFTISKEVNQVGLNWTMNADALMSGAVSPTVLLDFSADLSATVSGVTYSCVKVCNIWIAARISVLSSARAQLVWPGTADQILLTLPSVGHLHVAGERMLQGGFVCPKQAGFTGDIEIEDLTTGGTGDGYWIRMEGILMP